MVDLKEVRVGNYVHHKDDWSYRQVGNDFQEFDFTWDYKDFHALLECTLYPEAIEYIPITKEHLKKANFNFKELGFNDLSVSYGLTSGDIHFVIDNYHQKLEYLHELQNMYYDFTKKELTFKEKLTFKD
jgi:hypothetical protein